MTDIVYCQTADMLWPDISAWLLTVGLIAGFFAVVAGLIDFFGDRRIRSLSAACLHGVGIAVLLVLEIANAFVHTRDAYTSVVPLGLILSAVSVLILLFAAWNCGETIYRRGSASGCVGFVDEASSLLRTL